MAGPGAYRAGSPNQQGQYQQSSDIFQRPFYPIPPPQAGPRGQSAPGYLGIPNFDGPCSRRDSVASSHPSSRGQSSTRGPPPGQSGPMTQGPPMMQGPNAGQGPASQFPAGLGYDPAREGSKPLFTSRMVEIPPDAYRDPSKKYEFPTALPLRPLFNSGGVAAKVRVNQYKVLSAPNKTVYQYDVHIGTGAEKRGLIKAVWESNTIQTELKKIDKYWLFDGNKIAWSAFRIPKGEMRFTVDLDKEKGRAPRLDANGNPILRNQHRVVIRHTGQINMSVLEAYLTGKMQWDTSILEAITFLDHCMRQWPSQNFEHVKRSFFDPKENRVALNGVIQAVKGVYSSMRLCNLRPSNGVPGIGLAVNVDVANGTFWTSQLLLQAARNLCNERNPNLDYKQFQRLLLPVEDPKTKRWTMSKDFKELRLMHKLEFVVRHEGKTGESKPYRIKKFSFDETTGSKGLDATNHTFMKRDKNAPAGDPGVKTTVQQHYRNQYGLRLEYPNLPLVMTEKDGAFPMEVSALKPNQRYMAKMGPRETQGMIKFAVTRPRERIRAIENGVRMLKWSEDPYLNQYGIRIEPNMTVTDARVLPNPEVEFTGSKINPGVSGRWDLRGKKFLRGSNPKDPLNAWAVVIVENSIDLASVKNFLSVFCQTYTGHGGIITRRDPVILSPGRNTDLPAAVTDARKAVMDQCKREPQIILYILRDKNSFTYERLKKNMDCRYGIVSQMLQSVHVAKAQPQYCSNVCMKLNAKLGGTTCKIAIGQRTPRFLNKPTIIIGADVSHASPGSPMPSMAALTMSFDQDACRYAAAVQTNGYRVEMISRENIRSMLIPMMDQWIATVGMGNAPAHIYYFRDGVSEGQYLHVLDQEVKDMKQAIKDRYKGRFPDEKLNVQFTVVICSKRHHIRFFPKDNDKDAADRNSNPVPGVLVEKDVTHPFEYDFYLNSHSAIQGTARPVHYHVILDEAKVPVNILQLMIYQQCYQYQRSTTPVSLHPAVYYAHLASNRARAHESAPASEGPRGGQKFIEQQQDRAHAANVQGVQRDPTEDSRDKHTEAPPLIALGSDFIKRTMWYI